MSLKEAIYKRLVEYLDSTTIHGFSYLRTSRNILERLAWIIIIAICFVSASLLIYKGIKNAQENPISTTIETLSIEKVPFPAITVDSGTPDPWSYAERIFNGLAFDTKTYEGNNLDNTKLVEKVSPILDEIFQKLKNWDTIGEFNTEFLYDATLAQYFEKLAYVYKFMPEIGAEIDTKLDELSRKILVSRGDFSPLGEILEDGLKDISLTESDLKSFFELSDSDEYIKKAHQNTHLPYTLWINRGRRIGFGTFLAYFTRELAETAGENGLVHEFIKFEEYFTEYEKIAYELLNKYTLVNVTGKPVNSYELIKWLSTGAMGFAKFPTMAKFCKTSFFDEVQLDDRR